MSSFSYVGVTVIGRDYFPNAFVIAEKGMNWGCCAHTVALAVWQEQVVVAAEATKCIW